MTEKAERQTLVIDETRYETTYTPKFARRKAYAPPDLSKVAAVIPGVIRELQVNIGQVVRQGEPLLLLEAMKMQNRVVAPRDGKVKAIHAELGAMVAKGALLVELETEEEP
jgi:biotin carboxyl carrier protein